jgi:hypothetical protein
MFMLCHRIEARGRGHGPEQVDFARFLNHVSIHRQAFLELEKTGTTSFDLTGAIHDLTDLQNAAQRWSDGKISYDDFCYQGWDANQRLSARTTLVDVPQARELGLSLLEFNTEYSGLCRGLIPLVEKIDRALLIDPSLNRPQNGLGATCPPDIAEAVLRSFGCRVFLLQLGMETVGYYIFAPNPPKTVIPTESLFQDLARHGLIKDPGHTRYGFFHGVAITEAARATLRNAGIRGYRLLDYQMAQTALYEGCQTLVCTVRAGPNRNLAKKQHLDVGWQETGYEVTRRMPGASPLEVLLRDAATGINLPQGAIPQPPQNWGLNPHYRTYTSADVRSEGFTAAATISDYDAEICCRQFAAQTSNGMKVEAYHGSLGFYITISDEMERINFHQQRPGFDLWYCSATDTSAGLSEHLGLIDAQLRARRIGRDKYL